MKLLSAAMKVFKRDGQTLAEFNAEMKALTPEDRADLAAAFSTADPAFLAKHGVTLPVEV